MLKAALSLWPTAPALGVIKALQSTFTAVSKQ